jgi:uncharacterized C2H2 Zn-finger protein
MTRKVRVAKEQRCERCGKVFASLTRLQHHIAAEHAIRTSRDIRTTRDILHSTGNGNTVGRAGVPSSLRVKT